MRSHGFPSLFLALALFALAALPALSLARGPDVPCTGVDCAQTPLFDRPVSGFWGNPGEVGISIHLFMQNEVMFGMYYGYAEAGAPVWYLFTARFERPADAPGLMRAQATLEEYGNGSCIGCAYRPHEQIALPGTITLSFDQRNHGTYRIDGGEAIHIVPLMASSVFANEFAEQMHYALPDPEGAWVLTFKAEAGEGNPFERVASISGVFGAKEVRGGDDPRQLGWSFSAMPPRGEAFAAAQLKCTTYGDGSPPPTIPVECRLHVDYGSSMFPEFGGDGGVGIRFPLPYANIGDGRIVSENPETGIRLEAFRIGYD